MIHRLIIMHSMLERQGAISQCKHSHILHYTYKVTSFKDKIYTAAASYIVEL